MSAPQPLSSAPPSNQLINYDYVIKYALPLLTTSKVEKEHPYDTTSNIMSRTCTMAARLSLLHLKIGVAPRTTERNDGCGSMTSDFNKSPGCHLLPLFLMENSSAEICLPQVRDTYGNCPCCSRLS